MTDQQLVKGLQEKTKEVRREIIKMLQEAGSGHPGGSLSAAEIMTVLYFNEMKVRPSEPSWPERDRFVISKGHAAPVLYAVLALAGFFPKEKLATLRKIGSPLQGHPDRKKLTGLDASSGSLGQGISVACGMAKAAKIDGSSHRVYCLLGDGETQEGQVWEAAMFAAHYKLDNLVAILDHNHLQIDGFTTDVMSPEPLDEKWQAFGWQVIKVDGHSIESLLDAFAVAKTVKDKPVLILAETTKGKGVSFMENEASWHGSAPNAEQVAQALKELA